MPKSVVIETHHPLLLVDECITCFVGQSIEIYLNKSFLIDGYSTPQNDRTLSSNPECCFRKMMPYSLAKGGFELIYIHG